MMKNHSVNKWWGVFPLLLGTVPAVAQTNKPNFLWLTFEDTSPQFIGCYGCDDAKTPHIDALSEDGVRFTSAFSTSSVSSPSRFALYTGIPANEAGFGNHRSSYRLSPEIELFAYYLRQAGYYTTNNNKTDYNIQDAKPVINRAWCENSSKADWRKRRNGQPFFAVYNSMSSHQSRTMTDSYERYEKMVLSRLDEEEKTYAGSLEMPRMYADTPEMQSHLARTYNSISLTDKEFGQWLDKLEQDGLRDSTIIFCFSDHGQGIPRAKATSIGLGYRVPFIMWFPPMYAHLSPWGRSGIVTDDLISFEDLAPTLLSLAGLENPPYMNGRVILGNDRSAKREYIYAAVDRTGENRDLCRSVSDGDYIYTRVFAPHQPTMRWQTYWEVADIQQQMRKDYAMGVLDDVQTSIFTPRCAEYLYDLRNDKWELYNLVNSKEHKSRLARMRKTLRDHLLTTRDVHFIPEYTLLEQADRKYSIRLRDCEEFYPIKRVQSMAWLSGMGERMKRKQIRGLSDDNSFVQYWAAIGLLSQEKFTNEELNKVAQVVEMADYVPVKPLLLGVLYTHSEQESYMEGVSKMIEGDDQECAKVILQLLMEMPEVKVVPLLPCIRECRERNLAAKKKETYDVDCYLRMILHKWDGLVL